MEIAKTVGIGLKACERIIKVVQEQIRQLSPATVKSALGSYFLRWLKSHEIMVADLTDQYLEAVRARTKGTIEERKAAAAVANRLGEQIRAADRGFFEALNKVGIPDLVQPGNDGSHPDGSIEGYVGLIESGDSLEALESSSSRMQAFVESERRRSSSK